MHAMQTYRGMKIWLQSVPDGRKLSDSPPGAAFALGKEQFVSI